jgi:uncharacterized protein (TIGR03435 family)
MRSGKAAILAVLCASAIPAQDWQTKAGGKMAFEVASVKPGQGAPVDSNVDLDPEDAEPGSLIDGHFRANDTLAAYVQFAYKVWENEMQRREISRLPKWVSTDRYSIEARASVAHPTKDQVRLMVQSLLAERFQLAAHLEERDVPVYDLKLARPGKVGSSLIPHADGPPCDQPGRKVGPGLAGFACHSFMGIDPGATILFGSRDVTLDEVAHVLSMLSVGLGRPLVDKTELAGRYDVTIEWAREPKPSANPGGPPPAPTGPTIVDALRDQLGLKLEPSKATLPVLVVDKVERPSEN